MRDIKYIGTGSFEDRLFGSNRTWDSPGQVQEVPDSVAARMLRNPAFVEVDTEVVRADRETGALSMGGAALPSAAVHHATHFHGFAGLQFAGDTKFYDMAAGNHGGFGAHLSVANAWAQAGYVSSLDPATGATDSVIRIPPLNFDYNGGQKLIVWWLGAASPEASDVTLMGDCPFAQAAVGGVRIRAKSTGKADLVLYGSGSISRYGGASSATVFDGTLHSFALALDGGAKKYGMWCDEVYEPVFGAQYSSFSTGAGADTRSTNTWNLGAASAAPGGTEGMAIKTRGLLLMRLQAHEAMPSVATLTNLFKQLRANPGRAVSEGAF